MSRTGPDEAPPPRRGIHPVAVAAVVLAGVAWLLLGLSGPGTRAELWHFRTGFRMLAWGAYAGVAAAVLGAVAALVTRPGTARRGFAFAVVAVLLGALAFWVPLNWRRGAMQAPPIHDITTDVDNPPAFSAVEALRGEDANPTAYAGDSIAALQRAAYPDVGPVMLALPADSTFTLALAAAREMGWALVDADRTAGRIEATATTPFFGFKDDVVVRVSRASGIARVDVRSISRVGRGDAGANAARIRRYTEALRRLAGDAVA